MSILHSIVIIYDPVCMTLLCLPMLFTAQTCFVITAYCFTEYCYAHDVVQSCLPSAEANIPMTTRNAGTKSFAGWGEYVAPLRESLYFGTICGQIVDVRTPAWLLT